MDRILNQISANGFRANILKQRGPLIGVHTGCAEGNPKRGSPIWAFAFMASISFFSSGLRSGASFNAVIKSFSSPGGMRVVTGWESVNRSPIFISSSVFRGSYQHFSYPLWSACSGHGPFAIDLRAIIPVSYTHLRAHETDSYL